MPDKIKSPFVVEVEAPPVAAKVEEPVKQVIKPIVVEKKVIKLAPEPACAGRPELEGTRIQWGMFFAGVATTTVICGVSFGAWWMYSQRAALPPVVTASPTPDVRAIRESPLPSLKPLVWSKDTIKVDVLNGTGVAGKAGSVATKIVALGYAKGTTGNAATQKGSTISLSSDVASLSAEIVKDIESVVPGVTVSEKSLKGSSLIQVTLGE